MQFKKILLFGLCGLAPVINNGGLVLAVILLSKVIGLSTNELGQANLIFLITAFVMGLGGFGTSEAFYKFAQTKPDSIYPAIIRNLKISFFLLVVTLITNFRFNWLNLNSGLEYLLFGVLFLSFNYTFVCSLFLSLGQKISYSLFQLVHPILLLMSLYFLQSLKSYSVPVLVLAALIISLILPLLIMSVILYRQGKLNFANSKVDSEILDFSHSNIIILFSIMVIMQTDGLFLVNLLPDGLTQNGVFKSIAQVAKLAMAMGVFVSIPLAPMLAAWFREKNFAKIKKTYWLANLAMGTVSLILVVITSIWHFSIIQLLFTQKEIQSSSFLLPILLAFFCLSGMQYLNHYLWQMAGKIQLVWQVTLLQAIIFVVGMVYFVPQGLMFTAIFMLIQQFLVWIGWLLYFNFNFQKNIL